MSPVLDALDDPEAFERWRASLPTVRAGKHDPIAVDIVQRGLAGMAPAEIARATGINRGTVAGILSKARKAGVPIPYHDGSADTRDPLAAWLGRAEAETLRAEAASRGVDAPTLCAALLRTIARDGMVLAVLDDGAEPLSRPASQAA